MATLVLAKSFLERFAVLPTNIRKDVQRLLDKFPELSRAKSLHLEPIKGALDPRIRTVRVNQGDRGIVAAPGESETFILIDVLPHDDAIDWCLRRRLNVNLTTGALEVIDISMGIDSGHAGPSVEAHSTYGFLGDVPDDDLVASGIDRLFIPAIRALRSEGELVALAEKLPESQGEALTMLAAGYSVDETIEALVSSSPAPDIDPSDIAAAVRRPASGSAFYVVESAAALAEVLNQPLSHWRIFLHPAQRSLAYERSYSGPARVLGGAGTGKTVVALHRAVRLVRQSSDGARRRVLLTTFTRSLAGALRRQVIALTGDDRTLERMEVVNVDALAHRIVTEAEGTAPTIVDSHAIRTLFQDAARDIGGTLHDEFVLREWEQVILAQRLETRDEYFAASRAGQGVRLHRRQRAAVWDAVQRVEEQLGARGERTYLQVARAATEILQSTGPRYDHAVIDEAQDLHPVQWRLLRAVVPRGRDDLFIVGDAHQRIYDNRVSLGALGIDVRGRGARLRLNYRTTFENLRWAIGLLEGIRYDDLDGSPDDLRGYRSMLRGPVPTLVGFDHVAEERSALVTAVKKWMADGVEASEIAVATRTTDERKAMVAELLGAGISAVAIAGAAAHSRGGVRVATMHAMKGLEYRCVAVVGVRAGTIPLPAAMVPEERDPFQYRLDLARERSLLFVACTRARDSLRISWSGELSSFLTGLLPTGRPRVTDQSWP